MVRCEALEQGNCQICGLRPAKANDILCETCSDRYSKQLRTQRQRTDEFNARISRLTQADASPSVDRTVQSGPQVAQSLLQPIQDMKRTELQTEQLLAESQLLRKQKRNTTVVGCLLLGIGLAALAAAIVFASTILTFIGLGLTLWGSLMFFVQPKNYVRSDLVNATAISSLKTIDKMMMGMGYREKGVYIQGQDSDKAVVFVPSEPFSMIPQLSGFEEDRTFLSNPAGLLLPPPGLALAGLIEKKLGFKLKNCGLEALVEALPKVLVEDLEIVKDVEIEVKEETVRIKLFNSIYADFCQEVRDTSRRCGLGCPMCSALASILAMATGKPILYEEDKTSEDKRVTESVYQIINRARL